jgi:transcription initiation factor TFIIIB Brf1 subunit/transcription initiation factor TFIIB
MTDFDDFTLFEDALEEYKKISNNEDDSFDIESKICNHPTPICENGLNYCMDCGEELEKTIYQDKEWRFYGPLDNKRNSDPNRVQVRKMDDRNIYKDVENLGFNEKVVYLANKIYLEVTKGQIFRGNSRKAIIFSCIFHSQKLQGNPQSHEKLIKIFDLSRKIGLKGLKYVNINASKDSIIHTTYITPINLVEDIMDKFSATKEQKAEVYDLYDKIKNKSSKINRSRPQSTASSLVYFWICKKGINISLKDFARKVELSELTISKIVREICQILDVQF